MKKLIILLSAFSLLTACGSDKNISEMAQLNSEIATDSVEQTEDETIENTMEGTVNIDVSPTESTTKSRRDRNICVNIDETIRFESLEEFVNYAESANITEDFMPKYDGYTGEQIIFENFTPLIPKFDETKYELTDVKFIVSSYVYYFKNINDNKHIHFSISYDTVYHTYEEMVEVANMNLAVEVENIETTVWGDTQALIRSIPFTDPVEYSIWAMIDENNSIYLSMENMTPYELTACLNEFTFE